VLLRPPLFLFILLSLVCFAINMFTGSTGAIWWAAGLFLFIGGFMLALLKSETDKKIYRSLAGIPVFIFYQVLSLLRARTANKRSVATVHYHNAPIDPIISSNES
jgi:hypothetical protein